MHSAQLILVTLKAPLAVEYYYTLHVLDDYKRRKVLARDLLAFLLPAFLCLLSLWLVVAPESLLSLPQLRCLALRRVVTNSKIEAAEGWVTAH